jgi:hypothetical protein
MHRLKQISNGYGGSFSYTLLDSSDSISDLDSVALERGMDVSEIWIGDRLVNEMKLICKG